MARIDLDHLAELEEERRFLLRSLADLEREREAGDVDDVDYVVLRDGYTARAATVLRAIEQRQATLAPKARRNVKRTVVGIVVTAAVIVGLVALVLQFAAPRGDGDTITGGNDNDRIAALLSEGFAALETDHQAAIAAYRHVLDIEPDNVEALTYLGWVLALASANESGDEADSVLRSGISTIENAIAVDPTYADSYCFLSIIALRLQDDYDTAAEQRQACLDHKPGSDLQQLIEAFVTNPITVAGVLVDARAELIAGNLDAADALYARALATDPVNVEALTYQGLTRAALSESAGGDATTLIAAVSAVEQARALDPTAPDPVCVRAVLAGVYDDDATAAASLAAECAALDPEPALRRAVDEALAGRFDLAALARATTRASVPRIVDDSAVTSDSTATPTSG